MEKGSLDFPERCSLFYWFKVRYNLNHLTTDKALHMLKSPTSIAEERKKKTRGPFSSSIKFMVSL